MLTKALRTLLVVVAVLTSAPAYSVTATDNNSLSVDALGTELFLQSGSVGMVLVLVQGDEVSFRGYGETALGSHQLPTKDSLLRLDSLTKVFTADILNQLVVSSTVHLDDPLQHYAPAGIVVPMRLKPITLLDLATHTSGLPRELGHAPPRPTLYLP